MVHKEPVPDTVENFHRLTEEEGRLGVILKNEGGNEPRFRECPPGNENDGEKHRLPEVKDPFAFKHDLLPLHLIFVALQHFLAKHIPDRPVERDKSRISSHLGDVPGTGKVNQEFADRV